MTLGTLLIALSFFAVSAKADTIQNPLTLTPNNSDVCQTPWMRNLSIGSSGEDVLRLQKFLNKDPQTAINAEAGQPGSVDHETNYFGSRTAIALIKFQEKSGVVQKGTGYFGSLTRAKINTLCGNPDIGSESLKVIETEASAGSSIVEASREKGNREVSFFTFDLVAPNTTVTIKSIPVTVVTPGSSNEAIFSSVELYLDSTLIGTQTVTSGYSTSTVVFKNLHIPMIPKSKKTFIVRGIVNKIEPGVFDEGDSAKFIIDGSKITATDANENPITGSRIAESGLSIFRSSGITVNLITTSEVPTDVITKSDSAIFSIKYSLSAFGDDAYIVNKATHDEDGQYVAGEGNIFTTNGTSTISAAGLVSTAQNMGETYLVKKGTTETFTLTVVKTGTGFSQVKLKAIEYSQTNTPSGIFHSSNIDNFETNPLYISSR